ncbi:MAG: hypothetical protein QNJ65_23450 [Xenococcaceae cyanobacterium MO_234.B1]|nr:hypothetical protein [Xenococcaceae cyanobacterium MO_234.B1]
MRSAGRGVLETNESTASAELKTIKNPPSTPASAKDARERAPICLFVGQNSPHRQVGSPLLTFKIDVDCFGKAAPYLSTMIWATKIGGLMYLTCTDGRSLTGRLPENSLKAYGSYARSHPAIQEQALRLLIGSVQQQASSKGLGIEPIFSLWFNATYRVMLRLVASSQLTSQNYGFLGFCHRCGNYKTVSWRKLSQAVCEFDNQPLTLTGAMWLGQLHDVAYLHKMEQIAQQWQWDKVVGLLSVMIGEADFPPYFYTLREIGSRGKLPIPKRSHLIEALQNAGYRATITHINPEAIKTDADIHTCIKFAKTLNIEH